MSALKKLAIINALKSIMTGSFFSICDVDKLCSVLDIKNYQGTAEYKLLHGVHCIAWKEFDAEAKAEVLRCLSVILNFDITTYETTDITALPSTSLQIA